MYGIEDYKREYTLYTCLCGAQSKQNYVPALGHDFTNKLGMATNTCQRCGYKRGDYELPVPPIVPPIDNEIMGGGGSENVTGSEGIMNVSETDERTLESTIVTEYEYIYTGAQLTQMIVTTTVDDEAPTTETLYFTYESSGPMTVTYNGETYYYAANLQGDVVAILDDSGDAVVEYTYDAWGKHLTTTGDLATTLGAANPLTYRGYVYDTESTLYYLQSRYYDPEMGRFINTDVFTSTGQGVLGNNMFAYCGNNSVTRADTGGYFWDTIFDIASLCFSIADVVSNPADIGAWSSLAGDVIDVLLPCVTGVGEFSRCMRIGSEVVEAVDDAHDTLNAVDNASESLTTLYRSVSNAEAEDILATGRFNLPPGGMESKQFGFDLDETRQFGKWAGQDIIVSASIPTSMLDQFCQVGVDSSIFRAGTLTVYGDQLDVFNKAVRGTIKFIP